MSSREVLHLSKISFGGAAIATRRISDSFLGSRWKSATYFEDEAELSILSTLGKKISNKLDFEVGQISQSPLGVSIFKSSSGALPDKIRDSKVVKNVHWFPNFPFERLAGRVILTLHDMNQLTGACHHSFSCRLFESECVKCPQVISPFQSSVLKNQVKKIVSISNLHDFRVVSPSRWLAEEAKKSSLLQSAEICVIPNPVPVQIFAPDKRLSLRAKLELEDAFVIGGVSNSANPQKGGDFVLELYEAVKTKNPAKKIILIAFGGENKSLGIEGVHQFQTNCPEEMAEMLSVCDVFVYASNADNLPNILLEAQSAGVPIIAHDIGGITETYVDGKTGITAEPNLNSFCKKIEHLVLNPEIRNDFSLAAISRAKLSFSLESIGAKYIELYES
jgi:glycosyltransferase involved in cell wall biosynthesis